MCFTRWRAVLVMLLILCLTLVSLGCGAATKEAKSTSEKPKAAPEPKRQEITFGTASPTGAWMILASTIAKLINERLSGYNVTPVPSPRGSTENIETIMKGERELGFTMANIAARAKRGEEPFSAPVTGVLGWFSAHYGYWYLLARADSGIKSVSDLKGKRIAIGNPGDGDEALNKDVLPRLGLKWEDFKPEYSGFSGALDLIKDNRVDAIAYVAAPKLASLTDLMSSKKLRLVDIDADALKKLESELQYVVLRPMPRSDFPNLEMPEEATMVSINHSVIASQRLSEQTMYDFTKIVFENLTEVRSANKAFEVITLEGAVKGMPLDFHPGALKYFKEKGLQVR